jgi:hypothetical protein
VDFVVFRGDDQWKVCVDAVLGYATTWKCTEDQLVEDVTLVDRQVGVGLVVPILNVSMLAWQTTANLPPVRDVLRRVVNGVEPITSDQRHRI